MAPKTIDPNRWGALANNTKWQELQHAMSALGARAPQWRTRDINGFVFPERGWDGDWAHHFRMGPYKTMAWCELRPRMTDDALDLPACEDLCRHIGFELEVDRERSVIRLIGYRSLRPAD